jgi:hypothetical protein
MNASIDELLPSVLKLVNGDKNRCCQLIREIREQYPAKPMQWCLQKAIYDLRYGKKVSEPLLNPALASNPKPADKSWGVKSVIIGSQQAEKPSPISSRSLQASYKDKQQASSQPAQSKTKLQLIKLLNGDTRSAERLVENIRIKNPQHSEQWAYEKAVYDIESDRR